MRSKLRKISHSPTTNKVSGSRYMPQPKAFTQQRDPQAAGNGAVAGEQDEQGKQTKQRQNHAGNVQLASKERPGMPVAAAELLAWDGRHCVGRAPTWKGLAAQAPAYGE